MEKEMNLVNPRADTIEEIYSDFAHVLSLLDGKGRIYFSMEYLEYLIGLAPYEKIDFDKSNIRFVKREKREKTKIILKSGMSLIFTRNKEDEDTYWLEYVSFSWKDYNFTYYDSKAMEMGKKAFADTDDE